MRVGVGVTLRAKPSNVEGAAVIVVVGDGFARASATVASVWSDKLAAFDGSCD